MNLRGNLINLFRANLLEKEQSVSIEALKSLL